MEEEKKKMEGEKKKGGEGRLGERRIVLHIGRGRTQGRRVEGTSKEVRRRKGAE